MQNVRIQTAQNVFIEYQPASVGDRILATLIDGLIVGSYLILAGVLLANAGSSIEDAWWIWLILLGLPYLLYHLISEIVMDGQSIGKKALNIKVVKLDGTQPNVGSYLIRWILRPIDLMFSGAIAILVISLGGKGQRVGDLSAGTAVISLKQRTSLAETALPQIQDEYMPVYPQVTSLSDRDVSIIREALHVHTSSDEPDPRLLNVLANKVKGVLQVESTQPPMAFLRTVLKDHAHLTSNG